MMEESEKQGLPGWSDKERMFIFFFIDKIKYRLGREEVCRMMEEARQEAFIDDEIIARFIER